MAIAKILAVKADTPVHPASLPCQPPCLVSLPALFVPTANAFFVEVIFSKLLLLDIYEQQDSK
jgi:hypothetical protein